MSKHYWVVAATLVAVAVGTRDASAKEAPTPAAGYESQLDASLIGPASLNGLDADPAVHPTSLAQDVAYEAAEACDVRCVDTCGRCCSPGWIGYVEYLNWKARRRGLDFASYLNPVWLTPLSVESLDYDRESGFRAGVGYQFQTCWDVTWNYTYFYTDAQGATDAAGRPGVLNSTRSFLDVASLPGTLFDTVWAEAELDYDVHDVEVGRNFCINGSTAMRLFGGFRWATIEQDLRIWHTYRDIFQNGVTGQIDNPVHMDGYGIRLGAEGQWTSGCGLRLFGRAAASVLVGDFHVHQLEMDEVEGAIIDFSEDYTQAVPVLDVALGAAWVRGPFEISGGYELSSWFNMAEVGRSSYDLIFDGFFLRLAIAR